MVLPETLETSEIHRHYQPMVAPILSSLILVLAAARGIHLASGGRMPSALFFIAALLPVMASALLDLIIATGASGLSDWRHYLDWFTLRAAAVALTIGALLGIAFVLPPRFNLLACGGGLFLVIVLATGHLPSFGLPMGIIIVTLLVFAALAGWRSQRPAAVWLIAGLVCAALADVARNSGYQVDWLPVRSIEHLCLAPAMLAFGLASRAARSWSN